MSRPYVNVNIFNRYHELIEHLEGMLPRLKVLPGVIGITLNGGLARGFADHLSEVDITLYLEIEAYKKWKTDKTPIPLGIVKFDDILYDVKIINFDEEEQREYGDIELWDLSYAKILFDPHHKITELFHDKLSNEIDVSRAADFLWEAYWHFKLAGDIWINRGDTAQGHFMLNESIKPLMKALFIANEEYIPHEKWLIHMSRTLKWEPNNWDEKLTEAINVKNDSIDCLRSRQHVIGELFEEVSNYIKKRYYPEFKLDCHQKYAYDLLIFLVERKNITIEEWQLKERLAFLNIDPFHRMIEIREGRIILNKEKLLAIEPKDMYSGFFEIVECVIRDLNLIRNPSYEGHLK